MLYRPKAMCNNGNTKRNPGRGVGMMAVEQKEERIESVGT